MTCTRRVLAALAVCLVLTTGCGSGEGAEPGAGESSTPGRLLTATDEEGRRYREADPGRPPRVGIEIKPGADGDWDVRLTVRDFRFSSPGTPQRAVDGQGVAHLYVDGALVARLRAPRHHLPPGSISRGTHQVTVRLYADDDTVWALDGKPVESTADVTASDVEATEGAGANGGAGATGGAGAAQTVDDG
ncbi:hypothetical protein [Streptomyces tagetis]|uniref:hypothetical protein n=1 Tax=Streptomyces tagetis TaxID=2820809 RepID=UPI001FF75297|nr:hypothetical protein [Streptomyces sp. RG38]